jgi:hypothetical protein
MDTTVRRHALSTLDVLIRRRTPALLAWLVGRVPQGLGRRDALVAICRAELDWAWTEARSIAARLGLREDDDEAAAAAARLPHEQAAAKLLNAWGHLHPTERRIREVMARLRLQRLAAADDADWQRRAAGTLGDLRWYRDARRKQWADFLAAEAAYIAVRRERRRAGRAAGRRPARAARPAAPSRPAAASPSTSPGSSWSRAAS